MKVTDLDIEAIMCGDDEIVILTTTEWAEPLFDAMEKEAGITRAENDYISGSGDLAVIHEDYTQLHQNVESALKDFLQEVAGWQEDDVGIVKVDTSLLDKLTGKMSVDKNLIKVIFSDLIVGEELGKIRFKSV